MLSEPREKPEVVLTSAKVRIDEDEYEVFRNAHPTYLAYNVRKVSGNRAGNAYVCRQHKDGRQTCDCKDAVCRKRHCRHLLALQALGVFEQVEDRTQVATIATEELL